MTRIIAYLKKDGWLVAALMICVTVCIALGAQEDTSVPEENRISRVLSQLEGAGQVEVAVYYEDAIPCGAVVVADGAGSVAVQLRLTSALSALMGIDPGRIAVYPREGGHAP